MKILVGCEFSGVVRDAFLARGHDAYSCDLLADEYGSKRHLQCDVLTLEREEWDLAIFHPPCTHLAVSGARWWPGKLTEQEEALEFVRRLMTWKCKWAIENPIGKISTAIRRPDQIIQPWQYGHGEVKATCLWLNELQPLVPTDIVDGRNPRVHHEPPGPDRWKNRSRTLAGIASAMASQWG